MFYPTMKCNKGITHAVHDEVRYICGEGYPILKHKKQIDILKTIQFRHVNTINCKGCISELRKMIKPL